MRHNNDNKKSLLSLQLEQAPSICLMTDCLSPDSIQWTIDCPVDETIVQQSPHRVSSQSTCPVEVTNTFQPQSQRQRTTIVPKQEYCLNNHTYGCNEFVKRCSRKETSLLSTSPPCSSFSFQMKLGSQYDCYGSPPISIGLSSNLLCNIGQMDDSKLEKHTITGSTTTATEVCMEERCHCRL
jgi:hypothetical protein